jgi:hypothetical protein
MTWLNFPTKSYGKIMTRAQVLPMHSIKLKSSEQQVLAGVIVKKAKPSPKPCAIALTESNEDIKLSASKPAQTVTSKVTEKGEVVVKGKGVFETVVTVAQLISKSACTST